MTEHGEERAVQERHAEGRPETRPQAIRPAADRAGCGCLDCLHVDAVTLRRSFLGSIRWAVGLARRYPSVPAVALVLVVASRLLEHVAPQYLPQPVVGLGQAVVLVSIGVGLRAYVAAVAAADLTGGQSSPLAHLRATVVRLCLLLGVLWTLLAGVFVLSTVLTLVGMTAFVVVDFNPMTTVGVLGVGLGMMALVLLPVLLLAFKTWLALEACVLGQYGPVAAIRQSWRLSTSHRGKLLGLVAGNVGSLVVFALGPLVGTEHALLSPGPALTAVGSAIGELSSVVWYGVYAHLYVQAVLTE